MSQILDMARRLEEAEQTIAALRGKTPIEPKEPSLDVAGGTGVNSHTFEGGDLSVEVTGSTVCPSVQTSKAGAAPVPVSPSIDSPISIPAHVGLVVTKTPSQSSLPDLSVDQDGKICYYGPTSAIHNPPDLENSHAGSGRESDESRWLETSALLAAKARETESWEPFALKIASIQTEIPRPVIAKLLQIHWTWISPMFMWVYRPAFIGMFDISGLLSKHLPLHSAAELLVLFILSA